MRATHTYVVLDVSSAAWREIHDKLMAADYGHAFHDDVIDMHGIALAQEAPNVLEIKDCVQSNGACPKCNTEDFLSYDARLDTVTCGHCQFEGPLADFRAHKTERDGEPITR